MFSFMKDISSEIFIIYGLIIFTAILIAFMVWLDKRARDKKVANRTQELKVMDMRKTEDDYTEEFKKRVTVVSSEKRPKEIVQRDEILSVDDSEVFEIKTESSATDALQIAIDEEMYVEDDLEKTSAQIQLELLAQELEKAQQNEEMDRIDRFEAEQEETAIISYNELLKVCDDLYDKNEKVQYMDEGNEPINLNELKSRFRQISNMDSNAYNRGN